MSRRNGSQSMLKLYLDDAEDQDRLGVIAGYIAHEDMWAEFTEEWQKALSQAGVSAFHATDFFGCYGEFSGWKSYSKKHKKFRRRFTALAEGLVTLGIAWGIQLDPFRRLIASNQAILDHTPRRRYTYRMLCARLCCEWISIRGPNYGRPLDEPIAVVLESGKGMGEAVEYLEWMKNRNMPWMDCFVSFATARKDVLPLQAADLIANQSKRRLSSYVYRDDSGYVEAPLKRLLKRESIVTKVMEESNMEQWVPALTEMLNENDPDIVLRFAGHKSEPPQLPLWRRLLPKRVRRWIFRIRNWINGFVLT